MRLYQSYFILTVYLSDDPQAEVKDQILLFGLAFGDEKSQGRQGRGWNHLISFWRQSPVLLKEVDKEGCGNPLIAIEETMVLDQEIKKVGSFAFKTRIELLPTEGLVNRADRPFEETFRTFPAKKIARLRERQLVNDLSAFLIREGIGVLLAFLLFGESLMVVIIEEDQSLLKIGKEIIEVVLLFAREVFVSGRDLEDLDLLFEFVYALLVEGVAL